MGARGGLGAQPPLAIHPVAAFSGLQAHFFLFSFRCCWHGMGILRPTSRAPLEAPSLLTEHFLGDLLSFLPAPISHFSLQIFYSA